jgi:hypothetical protein
MEGHLRVIRLLAAKGGLNLLRGKSNINRDAREYAAFGRHEEAESVLLELQVIVTHTYIYERVLLQLQVLIIYIYINV